jgi:hypothetical protein
MGNVMGETWRLYEALEAGATPIIERHARLDYFRDLLGEDHPIPTFKKWSDAAQFMRRIATDPYSLDALQRAIDEWWTGCVRSWPSTVFEFITRASSAPGLVRVNGPLGADLRAIRLIWRIDELAKHHSLEAGFDRFKTEIRRRIERG